MSQRLWAGVCRERLRKYRKEGQILLCKKGVTLTGPGLTLVLSLVRMENDRATRGSTMERKDEGQTMGSKPQEPQYEVCGRLNITKGLNGRTGVLKETGGHGRF